jgi:hypothetical protein
MLIEELRATTTAGHWASLAHTLLADASVPVPIDGVFSTYWIEGGHRIREQVASDRLLVRLQRHLLPPYQGEATTLFRGENVERFSRSRSRCRRRRSAVSCPKPMPAAFCGRCPAPVWACAAAAPLGPRPTHSRGARSRAASRSARPPCAALTCAQVLLGYLAADCTASARPLRSTWPMYSPQVNAS